MKRLVKTILYTTLNCLCAIFPRPKAIILLYHDIGESDLYLTVSREAFESQMQYLKRNGYNVLPLSTLAEYLRDKKEVPHKTAVLTFDDGYVSHLTMALPTLEKYGFHGTFFVATDTIGKDIDNSEHKPQAVLDEKSLQELEKSQYASVEPHSCSHKEFTSLSAQSVEREVRESRVYLETLLKKTCNLFAYPRGAYDATSEKVLKDENFLAGVTVREGVVRTRSGIYALPRNTVHGYADMVEFKGKLMYTSSIISSLRNMFK